MVRLTVETAEHSREVETEESVVTIGRASRNTLRIADDQSSREHCRLERRDDGSWALVDLASRNGTHLNDKLVDEAPLHPGDRVRIGTTTITFELPGSEPEAPADEPAEHGGHPEAPRVIRLVFIEGAAKGRSAVVFEKLTTLGRRSTSDIVLTDTGASNRHAEIRRGPDGFILVDSGSRNGTFLNGRLVLRNPIAPDDQIRIGKTVIRVEAASADEETAAQIAIESEGVSRDDSGFITAEHYAAETATWSRAIVALLAATLVAAALAYVFRGRIASWVNSSGGGAPDLLGGRGSFDDRAAWKPEPDTDGAIERGVLAVRLPSRGPAGTLAAFDCGEAVAVERTKRYVVSARARTDEMGTGLAGVLATWSGKADWGPSASQLVLPAAGDGPWAAVEQRLIPPPWADLLHVSCVAAAPSGVARFDDVRVLDAHGTDELPRLAVAPLRIVADTPVLLSLFHEEALVAAGAGLVVEAGEGAAALRAVTARVADGFPRAGDGRYHVRATALLAPHGVELSIDQVLSYGSGGLRLEWRLTASKPVAVAFAGLELPCAASVLGAGVDVRTSGGFTQSAAGAREFAFEDVYGLAWAVEGGRVFLASDEPLIVQGRAAGATGLVRLGLRDVGLEARPMRLALTLRGTSAEDERALVGRLLAAERAARAGQFGDAIARYEVLARAYPDRRDVAERSERQLAALAREARERAESALRLMARARLTGEAGDFEAARAALAALRDGLQGTPHEAAVAAALDQGADLLAAAETQRHERDAARLVREAEALRGRSQPHTARLYCREVLARYPKAPAAAQARTLLDALEAPPTAPPPATQPQ